MGVFGENYSRFYDLLYKDKKYDDECRYINDSIIRKYLKRDLNSLLDIGCGTGSHLDYFKRKGVDIFGVDLSENMINEAKKKLLLDNNLLCGRASDFEFPKKFDVIISLFHVMSYHIDNIEIDKVFKNISNHLSNGGLFIFDFWYGPAVLTDLPTIRVKRFEDDKIKVTRLSEPLLEENENIVNVNFDVIIEDKSTHVVNEINELHKMRYFFLPEIKKYCKDHNLNLIDSYSWMTDRKMSKEAWYGVAVIQK